MSAADDARRFVDHLRVDEASDAILDALVDASLELLDRAYLIAHGDDSMPPLAAVTDPRVAPLWGLPYAAVWVGGEMPGRRPGETDEDYTARARHAVVYPRGMRRGSFEILRSSVAETLTGNRTVMVTERANGDLYALLVQTYAAETPDPAATAAAAYAAPIDASLVLAVEVIDGQTYDQLEAAYPDYDAVQAAYPDYDAVRTGTP